MHLVRPRTLILAALLTQGLVIAISCSLAGLADPPQASSGSSSAGSGGGDAGADGSGGDDDAGVTDAKLIYNAVDAEIFGDYVIQVDSDAGIGAYVVVPAEAGSCNNYDYLVFNVSVSAGGTYLIWARVLGTGLHNDTFFVQTDMGTPYMVRTSVLGEWVEDAVFDDTADVTTPIHYTWEAGAHQIIVECRSPAVPIDRLRLQQIAP
jgi:hypothetical protein